MPNLRYHYKHKKIFPNMWFGVVPRHIYIKILIYDFGGGVTQKNPTPTLGKVRLG